MPNHIMIFGIGSFAQAAMNILKAQGAKVSCYAIRDYGHYGPSLEGTVYDHKQHPNPVDLVKRLEIDLIIPMSIDWATKPWANDLVNLGIPIFAPKGEAMHLERERDLGRRLGTEFDIPFPKSYVARDALQASEIVKKENKAFVIKNPLCSPLSPIHTIVCETPEETLLWLPTLDYSEGVFLQEYVGRKEAGHIVLVSGGNVYSLVTNQEYKRAFDGNMGIVAGAPLGGLVEVDTEDRYGLARELIHPILPWLQKTNFHGPLQVTAAKHEGRWMVLEYNVRLGVTSAQMILRCLQNPLPVLASTAKNEKLDIQFLPGRKAGASVTLAGYGYPYTAVSGPELPITLSRAPTCDIWWNEAGIREDVGRVMKGHRIADVVAVDESIPLAISKVYENISNIHCLGSYYRRDVGKSLWPPGEA